MRYLLFWHIREEDVLRRSPQWREEATAFLAQFEDRLALNSELLWAEVLFPDTHAVVVGPGGETREGYYNLEQGRPVARVWAVSVDSQERAEALAGELAGQLDTWIEVREILVGAQRP